MLSRGLLIYARAIGRTVPNCSWWGTAGVLRSPSATRIAIGVFLTVRVCRTRAGLKPAPKGTAPRFPVALLHVRRGAVNQTSATYLFHCFAFTNGFLTTFARIGGRG